MLETCTQCDDSVHDDMCVAVCVCVRTHEVHVYMSMKLRCTDRDLPTVEDRCERCDLTPVQYSNRRVAGTVRASHEKGSVAGEVSAEQRKSNTDRGC